MASNQIKLSIRRSGAMGFDIVIYVDENPALQDSAMFELDSLLFKEENCTWIERIGAWRTTYKVGVSARSISADVKLAQGLLEQWIKICQKKYGKNLTLEMNMKS
jgi:hypothetical protein